MTQRASRVALVGICASMLLTLALFYRFGSVVRDPLPPEDVPGMVAWLAAHPADWHTASVLTDRALDTSLPRRFELWRASYALAKRLAPMQPNADAAFVRSGLFHWYELPEPDRRAVLTAVGPMLRDPELFRALHRPLWQLTRDFSLLRRMHPRTFHSTTVLRELAAANGLFDDYRALRDELPRIRLAELEARRALPPPQLLELTPSYLDVGEKPFVARLLEILPQEAAPHVPPHVLDFAARHQLRTSLTGGTSPLPSQWTNLCGGDLCTNTVAVLRRGGTLPLTVTTVQTDEIAPYVEVYVDDTLVAEGAVREQRSFDVQLGTLAAHRVEVRLANPRTRNGIQRRVRLS